VNGLVQYATGVERSTQHLKRHHYRSRHAGRWIPHGWFVETSQVLTDVGNWGHVKAGTAATLLAMTGRATLAHLKALSLPLLPLLKSVPLFAWAPGAAVTATAAAGGTSAAAALLLKRPLAAGGVAAASGAGAAAATGLGRGRQGEGRGQLGQGWGERLGSSIRAAAMALRRPGQGRHNPQHQNQQQQQQQQAVEEAVAVQRRGWLLPWGRRSQQQQHPQLILAAGGCVVGAPPTMFLTPDTPGDATPTAGSSSSNSRPQRWRHNPFDWGSHVLWLGGHALRATSGLVAAAGRRVGLRQGLTQQQVPLTAAAFGAPGAPSSGSDTGHPPRSAGRAVIGREGLCFDPVWAAVGLQGGGLAGAAGSSSSLRGGGARQTLHLPMPRLTWIAKNKRNMVSA
jgi:hypothetical protein